MNESASRLFTFAALLLALILGACSSSSPPPPLEGASMGGAFTLTNQEGRRVSDRDFAGKYRLVYFGYTFCPDVCPVDMQVIGAGLRLFEAEDADRAARVQPIFITVDPARDTPPVLREFTANFHPRLIGLTGTPAQVKAAADAFKVFYEKAPATADGAYMVNHSTVTYLFGPKGEPLATIPTDQGPDAVAAELEKWVS